MAKLTNQLVELYIKHLNSILAKYEQAKDERGVLEENTGIGIVTRASAALHTICGPESFYYKEVENIRRNGWAGSHEAYYIIGIVEALKGDLEDGYLASVEGLIYGKIFDDFLDMAGHLLKEGYKDAAAVIAGGTLETHLKQLCTKHAIELTTLQGGRVILKKASVLNQDLHTNSIYSLHDQKSVTAYLDLRNSAAHAKYSEYTDKQVDTFIDWLRDFISRNPA